MTILDFDFMDSRGPCAPQRADDRDGEPSGAPSRLWPIWGTILLVFVTGSLSIWGYVELVRWAFT